MDTSPYRLAMPGVRNTSVVFSSPHSGRDYPWEFLNNSVLDERTIRSSEDAFVDLLFSDAPAMGAPLLLAKVPRAYVDLNRSIEELDPALIRDVPKVAHNPRVSSGLGVIPRVVANGKAIQLGKMSIKDARARLDTCWVPYHARLQTLLNEARSSFGEAILIDCHSMPHEALESVSRPGLPRADVVIGDRFGASARSDIVEAIETAFRAAGLRVVRNAPFAGAYITQHYGRPSRNQHAVQIEIDRSLYMNERMVRPNGNFQTVRRLIASVISEVIEIGRKDQPMAAE
ncbi:N-formylglutamate amidohydrolase [Actibacterium mucosum KCTC 23349]|uniref:N-formylglutamate amidohydrolase n=1 Tax=Actibacterium mucosum KCTC 23349 TaxID=1454373 RepID=A0A037ZM84_9RHOB|nr:N-formylglutamate amidohydrolase [Actibacterium mucosum]KAJ57546.1 N-formylglutamate amidohydrolase [Actibacterium mucosum KCTC 23349]